MSKRKRSLKIILLSAFALVVAAGAYFIYSYPSAVPRFYQKTKASTPGHAVASLPDDTSQLDRVENLQVPPSPPTPNPPVTQSSTGPAAVSVPVRVAPAPTPAPNVLSEPPKTGDQYHETGPVRHTVRSLLGLISGL